VRQEQAEHRALRERHAQAHGGRQTEPERAVRDRHEPHRRPRRDPGQDLRPRRRRLLDEDRVRRKALRQRGHDVGGVERLAGRGRSGGGGPSEGLDGARALRHPIGALDRARDVAAGAARIAAPARRGGSSLTGPIGPRRRWARTSVSLDDVKTIRVAFGGTVNDEPTVSDGGTVNRPSTSSAPKSTQIGPHDATGGANGPAGKLR